MTANDNGQPRWQIETSHVIAAVLGLGGVGGVLAIHWLTKTELSDILFVLSAITTLSGGLTGILSPSPTTAGRIAAAAEVPAAVAKVQNAVNDKIRTESQ